MAIDTVVQRSAGLDIAKASLVACVRIPGPDGGWRVIKLKFTTMIADLLALRDWLAEHNIARVGMESTADYWRPVFYLLEQRFDCGWDARVLRLRQRVWRSGRSGGSTRRVPRCVGTGWPGVGGRGVLRRRVHPSGERGIDRSGPGPQRPGDRPVWACGHRDVVDGGTSATVCAVPRLR